ANVYLASAELAAVAAILGALPTVEQYMQYANTLNSMAPEIYRYLNFDQLDNFVKAANQVKIPAVNVSVAG
ncbi:MAG TPA: hypothetical protein PK724_03455, partial [Pseudomonadales bacterium]|nr:hypothetical protein [Pseudomonadales bacterium]